MLLLILQYVLVDKNLLPKTSQKDPTRGIHLDAFYDLINNIEDILSCIETRSARLHLVVQPNAFEVSLLVKNLKSVIVLVTHNESTIR